MMTSRRVVIAFSVLVAVFAMQTQMSSVLGGTATDPVSLAESAPQDDVRGKGWMDALICSGCVVSGIVIALAGWPAIVASSSISGSTFAVAACVAACVSVFTGE